MPRFQRLLFFGVLLFFAAACSSAGDDSGGGVVISTVAPSPVAAAPNTPPTPTPTPAPSGIVTLNAVGDLMLARDIVHLMDANGSVYPFAAVRHLLEDADITIANMEGTFTERGTQADKFYTFRTPPRHARGLAEAGIDVVALGNNHAMDFGAIGLSDTLAALDAAGISYSGAGPNEALARRPVIRSANGLTLAFLSYNAVEEATFAGPESPGVARASLASIREDVTAARQQADVVIVSLHAGTEYVDAPNDGQATLARGAIDAGADLVLGHHAHVFQGWQHYGNGVIVWGLGNFVFDLDYGDLESLGRRPFQTAVLHIRLGRDGVESVEARPVFIDPGENRPRPATPQQAEEIAARIRRLNGS